MSTWMRCDACGKEIPPDRAFYLVHFQVRLQNTPDGNGPDFSKRGDACKRACALQVLAKMGDETTVLQDGAKRVRLAGDTP